MRERKEMPHHCIRTQDSHKAMTEQTPQNAAISIEAGPPDSVRIDDRRGP